MIKKVTLFFLFMSVSLSCVGCSKSATDIYVDSVREITR